MDVGGVSLLLYSTHSMLSTLIKTPELALEEYEAENLARAIAAVSEHYDAGGALPPEALAWFTLLQTCAMIYGPRIFAIRRRRADNPSEINQPSNPAAGFGYAGGFHS